MIGTVIIDGTNILTTYNVLLGKGSFRSVVGWPSLKAVSGNDWQEYDGFEPDLSNPCLDSRTLNLNFILHGDVTDIDEFYRFLGSVSPRVYNFTDIGRTLSLRLVSMPSIEYAKVFHVMQCQFAADTPLEGYAYVAPSSSLRTRNDYKIDGKPLSDYGVRVLKGTVQNIARRPDVKPLLIRNISNVPGATYDENPAINDPDNELGEEYASIGNTYHGISGTWKRSTVKGTTTYNERDIVLNCIMYADTVAEAWQNYDALLYDLSKVNPNASDPTLAGARALRIRAFEEDVNCYYKSQSVTDFSLFGTSIWIKFNITLALFGKIGDVEYFLGTESGDNYISTENNQKISVSVAP